MHIGNWKFNHNKSSFFETHEQKNNVIPIDNKK